MAEKLNDYGRLWSRISRSEVGSYLLNMYPGYVNVASVAGRWDGYPLRCLYLGSV